MSTVFAMYSTTDCRRCYAGCIRSAISRTQSLALIWNSWPGTLTASSSVSAGLPSRKKRVAAPGRYSTPAGRSLKRGSEHSPISTTGYVPTETGVTREPPPISSRPASLRRCVIMTLGCHYPFPGRGLSSPALPPSAPFAAMNGIGGLYGFGAKCGANRYVPPCAELLHLAPK
jgi:hypothetical protein